VSLLIPLFPPSQALAKRALIDRNRPVSIWW